MPGRGDTVDADLIRRYLSQPDPTEGGLKDTFLYLERELKLSLRTSQSPFTGLYLLARICGVIYVLHSNFAHASFRAALCQAERRAYLQDPETLKARRDLLLGNAHLYQKELQLWCALEEQSVRMRSVEEEALHRMFDWDTDYDDTVPPVPRRPGPRLSLILEENKPV